MIHCFTPCTNPDLNAELFESPYENITNERRCGNKLSHVDHVIIYFSWMVCFKVSLKSLKCIFPAFSYPHHQISGVNTDKTLTEQQTHQRNIKEIDLEEKTQGTSCDLIGRSSDSITQLIAHRQPTFLLLLEKKNITFHKLVTSLYENWKFTNRYTKLCGKKL